MASNYNLSDDDNEFGSSEDEYALLSEEFHNAAERLQLIHSTLSSDVLLELYGLYKQATIGACNTSKPNIFNSQGRAKWTAWNSLGQITSNEAKQKYIEKMYSIHSGDTEQKSKKQNWVCISQPEKVEEPIPEDQKNSFDFVKENNIEKLKLHLNIKTVNEKDSDGLGLIHWAADRNATEILEFLLSSGADVNLVDDDGQTALHYASSCNNIDCVKILLKFGADKEIIDLAGFSCLDVSFDENVEKLLKN